MVNEFAVTKKNSSLSISTKKIDILLFGKRFDITKLFFHQIRNLLISLMSN